MTTVLALATAAALCTLLAFWGLALATADQRVAASAVPSPRKVAKDKVFILDAIAGYLGRPFTGLAMDLLAPWRAKIRRRIDQAGRPGGMTVELYARRTAGYVVLFGTLAVLLVARGQPLAACLCLALCLQNEFSLIGKRRIRQDDIERATPDFLDVLAVTVAAGLSFRLALARVADSMPGPVAEEFTIALRQMELGTPRRDAFEDLRDRNDSEAVNQFVTAFLQAEELGAPLTSALADISNDLRRNTAQWAKRKAQRTAPKITGVTLGMTLPALILLVFGAIYYGSGVNIGGVLGS